MRFVRERARKAQWRVVEDVMLVGKYTHNIDAKGRMFIPAKYRDDLGSHVFMYRVAAEGCIRVYSEAKFEEFTEKLSHSTAKDNDARRKLLTKVREVETDSQGRILIPEALRAKLGITDKAVVSGMIGWAEIWNPDVFKARFGDDDAEDDDDENDEDVLELLDVLGMC